jgi:type I restriction enzyme S subunit
MARAIFKDWFVDFGPTRAKMEGRDPHLAPELWALFPDQLDDEGKPEGWRDVPLGEITKRITKGTTPTKSEVQEASPQNEQVNFLKVNTLSNEGEILWDRIEQIPKRVHLTVLKRSILEENDILYSIAGTIGRVSIVSSEILPANTNQALAIVRPDISQIPPYFLWMQLRKKENQRNLHANIVQAVQANLSLTMLSSARCVLPPPSSIFTIFCHIESLLKKREFNEKENRTLAQTRGLLLPKLMSGEIRVKDAEKLAGEAT